MALRRQLHCCGILQPNQIIVSYHQAGPFISCENGFVAKRTLAEQGRIKKPTDWNKHEDEYMQYKRVYP